MNCAYSLCSEQLSSADKRKERSDERFKPTTFERWEKSIILNTNKIQEKICAEIQYKTVKNSYEIIGLIFSKFEMVFSIRSLKQLISCL